MSEILAIAAGGAVGAVARYLTVLQVTRWLGLGFPYGTLSVNVVGSLLLGLLTELLSTRYGWQGAGRSFFIIGMLGAYTTFSSFSLDAVSLLERHAYGPAALYIFSNVVLSIGALFLGLMAARALLH